MKCSEQVQVAIALGMPALHALYRKTGLSASDFWTGVYNTLQDFIDETRKGIEENRQTVGLILMWCSMC